MPSISGTYAFDPTTQSKILAISLYIQVDGKFPGGQTLFPRPDASGATPLPRRHSFRRWQTTLQRWGLDNADRAGDDTVGIRFL
jgi:hypothetical protein